MHLSPTDRRGQTDGWIEGWIRVNSVYLCILGNKNSEIVFQKLHALIQDAGYLADNKGESNLQFLQDVILWILQMSHRQLGYLFCAQSSTSYYLPHLILCGTKTPYGDTDLGQLWLRQWLIVWRHKAITWSNVDFFHQLDMRHSPEGNSTGNPNESNHNRI